MVGRLAVAISNIIGCKSKWPGDGWDMAGWLPLAISKDCGCNSRSLQNGGGMIGWLAPTSSKDFGDGWEMVGTAPVVLEHPIHNTYHQYNTSPYSANKNQNQRAGWLALAISISFRM